MLLWCVEQWLQDVIALQCSIMRHLSIKQNPSSTEWISEQKTGAKICATPDDMKPQASLERTSSPDHASKPCTTSEAPQGVLLSAELPVCKCSVMACKNCRKPNGPLAEEVLGQPPKRNGPVDCNTGSESRREAELQERLKPESATSELVNHIGAETIKTEPDSIVMEDCAQTKSPAAPTIWTPGGQQNHRNQEGVQSSEDSPPKDDQERSPRKLGSPSVTPGTD